MPDFVQLWVYLSSAPLFGLTATLAVYVVAHGLYVRSGQAPWANPVLWSVVVLGTTLMLTKVPYPTYFAGAQFIHFLLGPATVALAVPLFRHLPEVKRMFVPMIVALIVGSVVSISSAVLLAKWLGLSKLATLALAPKSATAAIAMGVAEKTQGDPALTAVMVIMTGISGAIIVTPLMNLLRLKNYAARGFAAGLVSHGIGTARAFQVNPLAGTFAGIALGLNGILTAILVPLLLPWLLG